MSNYDNARSRMYGFPFDGFIGSYKYIDSIYAQYKHNQGKYDMTFSQCVRAFGGSRVAMAASVDDRGPSNKIDEAE